MSAFPAILPSHGRKRKGSYSQPSSSQCPKSRLVTPAGCFAGRLKIPCGLRPQVVRDGLGAYTTHIKNCNKNSPRQYFQSLNRSSSYFPFAFYSAENSSFYKAVYRQGPRSKSTLDLSQWRNRFSIRVFSYYGEPCEEYIWCYLFRWTIISRTAYQTKIQHLFLVKAGKMTLISSSQLTHQVHLDLDLGLDLVMTTVGLGKGHKKENLFPYQGEWHLI